MAIRRRIAALAAVYSFTVRAVHIPGVRNHWADTLSRSLADLLSLSPSSSEITRAGPRWLEAQAQLDQNLVESLRPGSNIIPLFRFAAHKMVFSGADAFRGLRISKLTRSSYQRHEKAFKNWLALHVPSIS